MVNWNDYLYGNQNATTPTIQTRASGPAGPAQYSTDYETLYNQAKSGNYSNFTANQTGFAPGSSGWLSSVAAMPAMSGTSGIDFTSMLGPTVSQDTTTRPVAFTGESMEAMSERARAEFTAARLAELDLQQKQIQQAGTDRYQQARLAMEQRRALSDTRGLTAGAKEGAEGQLSAQEQLVLNQVESDIMNSLDNVELFRSKLPIEAEQYVQERMESIQLTDERFAALNSDDPATAIGAYASLFNMSEEDAQAKLNEVLKIQNPEEFEIVLSEEITKQFNEGLQDPEQVNTWLGLGMSAGIPLLAAKVGGTSLTTGMVGGLIGTKALSTLAATGAKAAAKWGLAKLGTSAGAIAAKGLLGKGAVAAGTALLSNPVGWAILAVGVGIAAYQTYKYFENKRIQEAKTPEQRRQEVLTAIRQGSGELRQQGYTEAQITAYWTEELKEYKLSPNEIQRYLGAISG